MGPQKISIDSNAYVILTEFCKYEDVNHRVLVCVGSSSSIIDTYNGPPYELSILSMREGEIFPLGILLQRDN